MGKQEPCFVLRMGFFPSLFSSLHKHSTMKKIFLILLLCILFIAGFFTWVLYSIHSGNGSSVSIKESDDSYEFYASYNRSRTRRVQGYIDAQLQTKHIFKNARIDATVTLDDKTVFYIKTIPGVLLIKLNKRENDFTSYTRIKKLGEDIKLRLGAN